MPDSLTPEVAADFASAFGTLTGGGTVLIGRDARASSPMLQAAVVSGLLSTGCDVLDFGVCPTPVLQFSAGPFKAVGAVAISGGHTRMGYNAITLMSSSGSYMDPVGGETILDIYHAHDFDKRPWNRGGRLSDPGDFLTPYLDALERRLNAAAIRKAGFTVVIDPVNGAGCRYLEPFARRFGFKLVPLNADESPYMSHDPEPRPRNARQLATIITHVHGDVGFVSTSDMGRISLVTEDGETASEEYTFPLIANHVLGQRNGVLVTNICTTRMVDDVAEAHGARVVRTAVGQAYIMSALADEGGVIGGEGNGSCALPEFSRAFDGFLMMGLVLEAMAQSGRRASQLLRDLPRYHIVKRQIYGEARRCYRALEGIEQERSLVHNGRVDLTAGLRIDWKDGWLHLRASRTEPMIRIISESVSKPKAEERAVNAMRLLEQRL